MTERKFASGLRPGIKAAQLRESVSEVVRQTTTLCKPILVEPIDFESFILKNKTLIQNDPHRELLLYPNDDVSEIIYPKKFRTISNCIPTTTTQNQSPPSSPNKNGTTVVPSQQHQGHLLTRQALHTYETANHIVNYKYHLYGGSSLELPRNTSPEKLKEEVYEIDADLDRIDEQMTRSQADTITKQGYLLKGPDTNAERMFAHIGSKSFKRRYCYLRQEIDGTYILEIHKDEKQMVEAKTTIVMDFCTEIIQNAKKGRFCFELRMTTGHKSFIFATDSESEYDDWLKKLHSVLQQNKLQDDKRAASLERAPPSPNPQCMVYGTLKGLEQSMNPQLIKYGRETDVSIAQSRKENRKKLFLSHLHTNKLVTSPTITVLPSVHNSLESLEIFKEQFGQRILLKCENLKFRLQLPLDNDNGKLCQIEPYMTSLALYDAKAGRKLTENFYFDLNEEHLHPPKSPTSNGTTSSNGKSSSCETKAVNGSCVNLLPDLNAVSKEWLMLPRQAIMAITAPHPDVFVVVKIEKILQGSISQSTEPYLKTTKDQKLCQKLQKTIKQYSQKVGHYKMPFAWAARPLFRLYSSELDTTIEFPAIYRQEVNRLKDEDLLKLLAEYRKPEKFSKLTVIPGNLQITIEQLQEIPQNCLTTGLAPIRPFTIPPKSGPTMEIAEFPSTSERDAFPYTTFVNHLFIYPLNLNFDSQKLFSRARNIAVLIELKDSDAENSKPLQCIYGRPGQHEPLVSQISCPVLHHNANPSFYEEIKARLPLSLTAQHHILFSFLHVSCNIKKKEVTQLPETPVGYAWLPLLNKGRLNIEEQCLPIAATLPAGYLSIQPLGLGKGNAGPDIQWIDYQKPLFQVTFRLDSTVFTVDQHLHNLFVQIERILDHQQPPNKIVSAMPAESETCKILKAAHAIQITSVITYLPTILNQLFVLLVSSNDREEIELNVIRLLIHLIHVVAEEANRRELILAYVKFVFRATSRKTKPNSSPQVPATTVHGELAKCLPTLLHPNNTDFLLVNKFMKYSSIFFDLIIKSMAQFLLMTGRIKMHRNERFPKEFLQNIESLFQVLIPYLISRHKDLPVETQQLNKSISTFVKRCLTYMDRGFVFKLIRMYMDRWAPGDPRTLQEFKFTFLQELCSHEHYIPLNLPFLVSSSPQHQSNGNAGATGANVQQHFTLSEEFCRHHFLAGLLLQEVKGSLNEVGHIRKVALSSLKELLAKHDMDDRYQSRGQLARISMLYIPWLGIVLENLSRISDGTEPKPHHRKHDSIATSRMSCNESFVFNRESTPTATTTPTPTNGILSSTPKTKRLTLHIEHPSPLRVSMYLKDHNYLSAIAGQSAQSTTIISAPTIINGNGVSTSSLSSECSTLSHDTTIIRNNNNNTTANMNGNRSHNRSISVTQPNIMPRTDKFSETETKDLLIAFLFIVKNIQPEHMLQWWRNCTESETIQFFTVLDLCLIYFRYVGKKNILVYENGSKNIEQLQRSTRSAKASTLPARMMFGAGDDTSPLFENGTMNHPQSRELFIDESLRQQQALLDSNMATEVGMIILDSIGFYSIQFRDSLLESSVLPKVAGVYLRFLQLGQSETLGKHVFAALRAFINNFSQALFKGNALLCGQMVYELLKCCDSRLATIRQEACAVMYLLMRSNFEFSGHKSLTRVHLQTIISVSQMVGNVIGLNNARFQESLSIINSYASSDKAMRGTGFPVEVKDLTRRVRTVLMATAQMQNAQMDPERLLELQYSLANSYASTPELRHTWLVTMARNHEQNGNISEAACCYLHISALIAEYLKLKGEGFIKWGAEQFAKISSNIPRDEKGLKLDCGGVHDSQYTEQLLLDQLKECAEFLDRAERYECLGELYRLIVPILEHRRDYVSLSQCYEHLMQSYNRIIDFNRTGKRLLGRFYRVTCFGQMYFEDEHAVEFIYKEPKVTSLSEISERLHRQYRDKFGVDSVKMIMDSAPVDESVLDPKIAYIQVTHVTPYYCKDELESRQNEFEQNHDVDTFMYETPFTKCGGGSRGDVENQWKRRTVLRTQYSFPYVLKRIPVKERSSNELSPIEVAIDEMQAKIIELEDVVLGPIDIKKLQLRLQGSVAVQVNAGPLAYASTFLDSQLSKKYPKVKVEELKEHYREFHRLCYTALQINGRLICNDQREYHSALKENFQALCVALSDMLGESFYLEEDNNNAHRNSLALFSAISGAPSNSSTA